MLWQLNVNPARKENTRIKGGQNASYVQKALTPYQEAHPVLPAPQDSMRKKVLNSANRVRLVITLSKNLPNAQCAPQAPSATRLPVAVPHVLKAIIHTLERIHASHVKNED